MAEILLVDDERVLREGLNAQLVGEGFEVRTARDGEEAVAKFAERRPDLVLLDVMMPKMNGFRACEEIRRQDALVPIVFLTAKDSEADQVRGIGLGADDYISKDAGESLLVARIRRALERSAVVAKMAAEVGHARLELGRISVDLESLVVYDGDVGIEHLTKTEAGILKILGSERGRYFSLDELITGLRGGGFACVDSMVYVHVFRLRQKLGAAADMIVQERGTGYCLSK